MNRRRLGVIGVRLGLVGLLGLSLIGCRTFQVSDRPIPGSTLVVRGDWDDVETSVDVGMGWAEMAVLGRDAMGEDKVRYRVITVLGESGSLIAKRAGDETVSLSASFDGIPGGDAGLEAKLIRGVARRLEQLAGRDVAPIR